MQCFGLQTQATLTLSHPAKIIFAPNNKVVKIKDVDSTKKEPNNNLF